MIDLTYVCVYVCSLSVLTVVLWHPKPLSLVCVYVCLCFYVSWKHQWTLCS